MSKILRGRVKREPMFAVGEVVVSPEYGRGVVSAVDSSGYLKIVFEGESADWTTWWFTPSTVTKLQEVGNA
jgi:hypothetical protein